MYRTETVSAGRRVSPARYAARRIVAGLIAVTVVYLATVGAVSLAAAWTVV